MTNTDTRAPTTRTSRWVKIALALSVALNLAVIGVIAGATLRASGDEGSSRRGVRDVNFGPFTEALTREQRRNMLGRLGGKGSELREMRAQMRGDLDDVVATLRAEPFDPAAVEAAFARQGARLSARADAGRGALVGLILEMSKTDRAAFVERLENATKHRHSRGKRS